MKIYVLIYNEDYCEHAKIAIECDAVPIKGQSLLLSSEDITLLEWKAIECIEMYCDYIYGWEGRYYLDLEDIDTIEEIEWRKMKDGKYYPFITMKYSYQREELSIYPDELTEEIKSQIRTEFLQDHPSFTINE